MPEEYDKHIVQTLLILRNHCNSVVSVEFWGLNE